VERVRKRLTDIIQDSQCALQTGGWRKAIVTFLCKVWQSLFSSTEYILLTCLLDEFSGVPESQIRIKVKQGTSHDLGMLGTLIPVSRQMHLRRLLDRGGFLCRSLQARDLCLLLGLYADHERL
jgi:hypothetical protein